MLVRLDQGGYWLRSRQTFDVAKTKDCGLADSFVERYRPFLSDDENRWLLALCDAQVKRTRFQLRVLAQLVPNNRP